MVVDERPRPVPGARSRQGQQLTREDAEGEFRRVDCDAKRGAAHVQAVEPKQLSSSAASYTAIALLCSAFGSPTVQYLSPGKVAAA